MAKKTQAEEPVQFELALPDGKDVVTAVKKLDGLQKAVSSASGEMGKYVEKLADEKDFDKRALGIVRRIQALPDEKFAITWPHVLHMADALGFEDRLSKYAEGAAAQKIELEEEAPARAKKNGNGHAKHAEEKTELEATPDPLPERVTRLRPPNRVQ